eukprot:CAMPEP_0119012372 /NCGR_PEP_ID=MMETSP1176-20130426/6540_1 /TAXON_ID=265551 /ORGANISM="Synedropsis recta cf, Strain CCMP1620" /LENGTH=160 /DNA_ID=CAMNT_0006965311 /DNA_START=107 /DNA_END=589 /DNA_ORIENTATION=+
MKTTVAAILCMLPLTSGFSFVHKSGGIPTVTHRFPQKSSTVARKTNSSPMQMLDFTDPTVLKGAGVAVAGLVAGIGLVSFTENQGERAKERGGGLSDGMATKITGQLMEDVEIDSVSDLGSLTEQLEAALKESTSGGNPDDLTMSEEDKKRISEEAEDGW